MNSENKKEINPPVYKISVTEKQLHLIVEATDLMSFLLFGNIRKLWNLYLSRDVDLEAFDEACDALKKIVFPELHGNASYGVGWKEDDHRQQKAQMFYEIESMLRHELWKRDPNREKFVVSSSEPLHYSNEQLIAVEKIKED